MAFVIHIVCIHNSTIWVMYKYLHRLKQPVFHCYREQLGVAKTVETLEKIAAEMKAQLLVSLL